MIYYYDFRIVRILQCDVRKIILASAFGILGLEINFDNFIDVNLHFVLVYWKF
jgi:hypothetical protein